MLCEGIKRIFKKEEEKMDLSRVFGTEFSGPASYAAMKEVDTAASALSQVMTPHQALRSAYEASISLNQQMGHYEPTARKLIQQITSLSRSVDIVKAAYKSVEREKDNFAALLNQSEQRLAEVQRVVQRYTVVKEPVVASDGFTYERHIIKQYLDDCLRQGVPPQSQQTQSELAELLVPNQSLKKLVELLKGVKPPEPTTAPTSATNASNKHHHVADSNTNYSSPSTAQQPSSASKNTNQTNTTTQQVQANNPNKGNERLHPCVRVYGYCNYKESCTYAQYPYDACLSHLKGKCRFGAQCHELHVDFQGGHGGGQQRSKRGE